MADKNIMDLIAIILLIIGGLNWSLAIWGINLVTLIFRIGWLVNTIYALVGISALYEIYALTKK